MALGNMLGGLSGAAGLGGIDDIVAKMGEMGIDASMLEGMDIAAITSRIEEMGIDLSMLEGLGIFIEDVVAKLRG